MAEKKKKQKEKAERPLEEKTIKELREEALKIQGIQGVHGMNKEELVLALRAELGMPAPEVKKSGNIRDLKAKILEMRAKRDEERVAGASRVRLEILRKKIHRMRREARIA